MMRSANNLPTVDPVIWIGIACIVALAVMVFVALAVARRRKFGAVKTIAAAAAAFPATGLLILAAILVARSLMTPVVLSDTDTCFGSSCKFPQRAAAVRQAQEESQNEITAVHRKTIQKSQTWPSDAMSKDAPRALQLLSDPGTQYSEAAMYDPYLDWGTRRPVAAPDNERALEFYRKSAAQGYPASLYVLGHRYLRGEGVPQDDRLAEEWLLKAARSPAGSPAKLEGMEKYEEKSNRESNASGAQIDLGYLKAKHKDYAEAYFWLALSQDVSWPVFETTEESRATLKEEMRGHLTPEQIAAADKRVAEWKYTKYTRDRTPQPEIQPDPRITPDQAREICDISMMRPPEKEDKDAALARCLQNPANYVSHHMWTADQMQRYIDETQGK